MPLRKATPKDLPYCLEAAKVFTAQRGQRFDEQHATAMLLSCMQQGASIVNEKDGQVVGHSAALIVPDIYSPDLMGRVFTTWGNGGLKCLKLLLKVLKLRGVKRVYVDCPEDSKLNRIYKRMGFAHSYNFYEKEL